MATIKFSIVFIIMFQLTSLSEAKVEPKGRILGCEPFPTRCNYYSSACEKLAQYDMFLPGNHCVRLCYCIKNNEKRVYVIPDDPTKCVGYDASKTQQCPQKGQEMFELDRKLGVRCEFRCRVGNEDDYIDITNPSAPVPKARGEIVPLNNKTVNNKKAKGRNLPQHINMKEEQDEEEDDDLLASTKPPKKLSKTETPSADKSSTQKSKGRIIDSKEAVTEPNLVNMVGRAIRRNNENNTEEVEDTKEDNKEETQQKERNGKPQVRDVGVQTD